MLDIVIATRNPHKFRELRGLLRVPGIHWQSLNAFPRVGTVKETGRTFDANARKKALALARATGRLALADDSGLEVDALDGAPGVRSARFAGGHGDDQANNRKLLRLLGRRPMTQRHARYRCVLALASPRRVLSTVDSDVGPWHLHSPGR
jgi:XTP/dITP diphosphohydrolase